MSEKTEMKFFYLPHQEENEFHFSHDNMVFTIYLDDIESGSDTIGCYCDLNGVPRKIKRDSLYGDIVVTWYTNQWVEKIRRG